MLADWDVTALDFDDCIGADGSLPPEIAAIVADTYSEYSPSGHGVRAFVKGQLGNRKDLKNPAYPWNFEVFSSSGYVTFTGNPLPTTEALGLEDVVTPAGPRVLTLCEQRFGSARGDTFTSADPFETHEPPLGLSVTEMEAYLSTKLEGGYSARIAAGYCWPWSDPRIDGSLVSDVQVGDWSRPWNLKGDRSVGGAPAAALWASDPAGFDQVGCVYTAQGFEYDYAGVIFGPDLVWRDNRWVSVRAANRDPDFKNKTKVRDLDFDRLVRNVYKVLLTRGMRGVTIYSTDHKTQEHLRTLTT